MSFIKCLGLKVCFQSFLLIYWNKNIYHKYTTLIGYSKLALSYLLNMEASHQNLQDLCPCMEWTELARDLVNMTTSSMILKRIEPGTRGIRVRLYPLWPPREPGRPHCAASGVSARKISCYTSRSSMNFSLSSLCFSTFFSAKFFIFLFKCCAIPRNGKGVFVFFVVKQFQIICCYTFTFTLCRMIKIKFSFSNTFCRWMRAALYICTKKHFKVGGLFFRIKMRDSSERFLKL